MRKKIVLSSVAVFGLIAVGFMSAVSSARPACACGSYEQSIWDDMSFAQQMRYSFDKYRGLHEERHISEYLK